MVKVEALNTYEMLKPAARVWQFAYNHCHTPSILKADLLLVTPTWLDTLTAAAQASSEMGSMWTQPLAFSQRVTMFSAVT